MLSNWSKYKILLYAIAYMGVIAHTYEPLDLLESAKNPEELSDVVIFQDPFPDITAISYSKDPSMPRTIPCPNPSDIMPCECYPISNTTIDINCSNVTSEEQIRSIFNKPFPFTNFRTLTIKGNLYVNVLRGGDLGKCTFQNIDIRDSALIEIDESVLEDSYETLLTLVLINNNLNTIPDISQFRRLWYLDFQYNALLEFPLLYSNTLTKLVLQGYPWETVPGDALQNLPALESLDISYCSLYNIKPDTFSNNQLGYINLGGNNIEFIPNNAFKLIGSNNTVMLHYNRISTVPPGAFSGITGTLQMSHNSLKYLSEEVWRPLLESNVMLYIEGNPFECGCDIAWLILNETLLSRIHDTARCYDGEAFTDLNPEWYENMC
ncbi:oplophorus-luciferin 2-monooxygenase non-catalytic subunit-like [Palaemon carinicauda]|uniref:oplophorus-luciferin 2-monooxygenase non-catalytic subunit-like n=1 Tax=Palaemon carinicauda TaxID=392227 RepID=UPI0035B6A73D